MSKADEEMRSISDSVRAGGMNPEDPFTRLQERSDRFLRGKRQRVSKIETREGSRFVSRSEGGMPDVLGTD